MVKGLVYFKDGRTEETTFIERISDYKTNVMIFETCSGRYGHQNGVMLESIDGPDPLNWVWVPYVHFYQYDYDNKEWARTDIIEKITLAPSEEEV